MRTSKYANLGVQAPQGMHTLGYAHLGVHTPWGTHTSKYPQLKVHALLNTGTTRYAHFGVHATQSTQTSKYTQLGVHALQGLRTNLELHAPQVCAPQGTGTLWYMHLELRTFLCFFCLFIFFLQTRKCFLQKTVHIITRYILLHGT